MPIFNEQVRKELIDFLSLKLCFSINDELYTHYFDEDYSEEDEEWYEEIGINCEAERWEHGASKMVLFYSEIEDWVVKIPFFGDYYEEEDRYSDFENANLNIPIDEKNDYCATEAFLTEKAIAAGLSDMFACTYYLFNIGKIPIYVAENIDNSRYGVKWNDKAQSVKSAANFKSRYQDEIYDCHINETDLARFIDCYGEDATSNLIDFISYWRINDLHMANVSFDEKQRIRLVDYSGFQS